MPPALSVRITRAFTVQQRTVNDNNMLHSYTVVSFEFYKDSVTLSLEFYKDSMTLSFEFHKDGA